MKLKDSSGRGFSWNLLNLRSSKEQTMKNGRIIPLNPIMPVSKPSLRSRPYVGSACSWQQPVSQSWYQRDVGTVVQIYSLKSWAFKAPWLGLVWLISFTAKDTTVVSYSHYESIAITLALVNANVHRAFVNGAARSTSCSRTSLNHIFCLQPHPLRPVKIPSLQRSK